VVGEPVKASQVGNDVPFGAAARALAIEFACYAASLIPLFAAGIAGFALVSPPTTGVVTTLLVAVVVLLAGAVLLPHMRKRVRQTPALSPRRLALIAACEAAYQLLAILEGYITLLIISPRRPTIASAVILETVSRGVTMLFKMIPMRIGVDEASASFVAGYVSLDPATGVTLALVRKLRLLFWSAVGLVLLVRRRASAVSRAIEPSVAIPALAIAMALLAAHGVSAQDLAAGVSGTVTIGQPDGTPVALPGVTVTLRCGSDEPAVTVSDAQGAFSFSVVTGTSLTCSVGAALEGFSAAARDVQIAGGAAATVNLQLGLDTLREEITVRAVSAPVDSDRSASPAIEVPASMMQTAPLARERFQDALPLVPGVVRGPDGLLNISGLRSNQSALTFNNANGTDPVTGEDAIELPIDAVSSVQVRDAAYAPEFGLSAGAITVVETQKAGDSWDVTVNDLEPRLRRRGGEFRGIESWTPRATVGGPIVAGRLQLLESVQYEYSQTRVFGLPPFESDTKLESFETFTRADWLRRQADRMTASLLAAPRTTTYAGLNTFNPQGVAADVGTHNVLGSVSDALILSAGVVDTRVSVKQFDTTIDPSRGTAPMVLAPDVNSGSYFNDQDRTSRRAEWLTTYTFTPIGPAHVVKAGGGITYETFEGTSTSRPVRIVREDGTLTQLLTFAGSGMLDQHKIAVRGFVQDCWTAGSRLTVLYGVRYDHESITSGVNVAPRGSATVAATSDGRTIVRAGVGVFYHAVPLNVASFGQMQTRSVASFAADGEMKTAEIALENIVTADLRAPRGVTWNVEIDRELTRTLFVRAGYQERDNRDEPFVDADPTAILLRVDGQSRYREAQVTARYTFHGADRLFASYTRSAATGNLNDFNTYFGNVANPVVRADERGPLPWDAPNRVLIWSSITLPHGFAVFPVLDARTGFPLSNVDADRNFVGPRNRVGRYPAFLSLDAQITKKLQVIGHNATIGLKVFNITDHFNPRDYQGNIASSEFGGFNNSVGRTFRGKWVFEF
jgi:hypothetical protein